MSRIALFGGTFDPIHNGHLNLALTASRKCELERLIFLPNYISPFKADKKVTPGEMRAEMLESILHYDDSFEVSRYEIERETRSYTFNTLEHFSELYGENIAFIIGYDSLMEIDTWYRGKEILTRYHLIVGRRPDYDDYAGLLKAKEYEDLYGANITMLDIKPFRASSSMIREELAKGNDVSKYLPDEIEEYIKEHGLYTV